MKYGILKKLYIGNELKKVKTNKYSFSNVYFTVERGHNIDIK